MDGNRKSVRKPRGKSQTHDFADKKRGARLQKVLADAGVAARRECEELILSGAVTVNGHLVDTLPAWANPATDRIEVYGRPLRKSEEHVYVVLFKPRGTVCTNSDPEGRPRAIDLVQHPSRARLYCVGRLDLDTSGLLVLTNDGELANRLSHPRYEVPKGYDVTLDGSLGETEIARIEREIFARDKYSRGARDGGSSSLRLINRDREKTVVHLELCEHRNLQIRPLMLELGHPVKKLRRTSFGPLKLKGLAVGEWRDLTPKELDLLRRASRHEGAGKALQPKAPKRSMEEFAEAREARAAALVQPESGTQSSASAPLAKPVQPRDGIAYNEEARPERTARLSSKFAPKPFVKSSTKSSTKAPTNPPTRMSTKSSQKPSARTSATTSPSARMKSGMGSRIAPKLASTGAPRADRAQATTSSRTASAKPWTKSPTKPSSKFGGKPSGKFAPTAEPRNARDTRGGTRDGTWSPSARGGNASRGGSAPRGGNAPRGGSAPRGGGASRGGASRGGSASRGKGRPR